MKTLVILISVLFYFEQDIALAQVLRMYPKPTSRQLLQELRAGSYPYPECFTAGMNIDDSIRNRLLFLLKRDTVVPDEVVEAVATAGIKEAIPLLKRDLASQDHHSFHPVAAELALARLGDKNMQQKILKECAYDSTLQDNDGIAWRDDFLKKFRKLIFVSTQESICQLHYWLDTSKYVVTDWESKNGMSLSANWVVASLLRVIVNKDFQNRFKNINVSAIEPVNINLILECRKWLIQNKGKYEIDHPCSEY
jgi:hypothetical protein